MLFVQLVFIKIKIECWSLITEVSSCCYSISNFSSKAFHCSFQNVWMAHLFAVESWKLVNIDIALVWNISAGSRSRLENHLWRRWNLSSAHSSLRKYDFKLSSFFKILLKQEARTVPFPNHGTCIIYIKWYTILKRYIIQVKVIFSCCKYALSCSTMFCFCHAHIVKVISNDFRSVSIIYMNTNWVHFLNTSVITAICATTIWINLTMFNYKVKTMCTKSLIYNCNGLGSGWLNYMIRQSYCLEI